jgi:hypothetical protein
MKIRWKTLRNVYFCRLLALTAVSATPVQWAAADDEAAQRERPRAVTGQMSTSVSPSIR